MIILVDGNDVFAGKSSEAMFMIRSYLGGHLFCKVFVFRVEGSSFLAAKTMD